MRNIYIIFSLFVLAFTGISCSSECSGNLSKDGLRTISFQDFCISSKSIKGSVELPSSDSLYWVVTSSKKDGGDSFGEGVKSFDTMGLDDKSITLSYGDWEIVLEGFLEEFHESIIYRDKIKTTVDSKTDSIEVELDCITDSGYGKVKIHTELPYLFGQRVFLFDLEDGEYILKSSKAMNRDETEGLSIIDLDASLSSGVHEVKIGIGETRDNLSSSYIININIYNNINTNLILEKKNGDRGFVVKNKEYTAILT